jgi:hypothetical protein
MTDDPHIEAFHAGPPGTTLRVTHWMGRELDEPVEAVRVPAEEIPLDNAIRARAEDFPETEGDHHAT